MIKIEIWRSRKKEKLEKRQSELDDKLSVLDSKLERMCELLGIAFTGVSEFYADKAVYIDKGKSKPDAVQE